MSTHHRRILAVIVAALAGSAMAANTLAEQPTDFARPAYSVLRFSEDWSGLANRDRTATGDLFDPIKFIPLSDDQTIWASFGGQVRGRYEEWRNFGFGNTNDDGYWLGRLMVHADVHIGEHVRVFVEGKSAFGTDRDLPGGQRTLDIDHADIQNGFVDIILPIGDGATLTLRGGRQELLFGKQRLVSPLDWANTRRTFDGGSVILNIGNWNITGFWTEAVPVQKYDFNDSSNAMTEFFGIYATGKLPNTPIGIDLYWLALDRDASAIPTGGFNGSLGDEERHTIGGRLFGAITDTTIDYDIEGAYQFGEVGSADISAYMLAGEVGVKLADMPTAPRVHVGAGYASGDDSAGGDVGTFNQLFPLGHAYLGWIDFVGRQNVIDVNPGLTMKVIEPVTVKLNGHLFWRADTSDALYNAGGGISRAGAAGGSSEVGSEIDLLIIYQHDRHTQVLLGYSHFFAGPFIKQSGGSDDIDFAYAIYQFTF